MNAEEKTSFEKMKETLTQIERDVLEVKSALLGNPLSGDKGLVGQLTIQNARIDILDKELKMLREERVKNSVYIKIIAWLSAVIGAGVIGTFFDFFKK